MASVSIQGRVDGDVWQALKEKGETNTDLLQRITAHYTATSGDELLEIAPTFDGAIAVLLNSHRMLNQLLQNAAIALPATEQQPDQKVEPTTTEHISSSAPTAAQEADEW